MKRKYNLQTQRHQSRRQCRTMKSHLEKKFLRVLLSGLFALMLAAGCKTAPPKATLGYNNGLLKSASHGNAEAQFYLGQSYETGNGVAKDSAKAAKWYREAANQGVPWAQFNLGRMCYNGDGVTQDHSEAFWWVQKAAVKGLAEAQTLLGAFYGSGDGIEKNDAEAFKWFNKAANQGVADAQDALGHVYQDGTGVKKDPVQSYKWFTLAAANGDDESKTNLPAIEKQLSAKELSQARRLASEFKPFMTNSADCSWSGNQTFSLKPETGSATGFFVTDDGFLVTNYHVVKDAGEIFLVTPTGTIAAEVVKTNEANDLALLKASGQFSALPIADSRNVKLGSPVITVGFPNPPLMGFLAKFSKGDIAALSGVYDEPLRFQISVPIQPGNSGGALLDGCGNVVGIVSQGIDLEKAFESDGIVPQNVNYAIKSIYLSRLLESVPEVSGKLKPPGTKEKTAEEIAGAAEQSSVLILVYGKNP
jgi:TPR repeat protein